MWPINKIWQVNKRLRKLVQVAMLVLFAGLFAASELGMTLEEHVGLPLLFKLRGALPAPEDVSIVSLDQHAAEQLGLVAADSPWPRALHACLVEHLTAQAARLIVIDVFFRAGQVTPKPPPLSTSLYQYCPQVKRDVAAGHAQTQVLADAIRRSGRVLLLGRAEQYWLPIERRRAVLLSSAQPPAALRAAALGVAPFPLLVQPGYVPQYLTWLAWSEEDRQVTLPLAVATEVTTENASPTQYPRRLTVNLFGPGGQVCTRCFSQVMGLSEQQASSGCQGADAIADDIVFVGAGWSTLMPTVTEDSFVSPFTLGSGQQIRGVELLATASSNLLSGEALPALSPALASGLGMLSVVLLGCAFALRRRTHQLTLFGMVWLTYAVTAYWLFSQIPLWLPVITPLLVVPVLVLAGLAWRWYRELYRLNKRYIPPRVRGWYARYGQRPFQQRLCGVCLYSDIEAYTGLSERLPVPALADFSHDYFDQVSCVMEKHGGEILNIDGDALVAFWPCRPDDGRVCLDAVHAALACCALVEQFAHPLPGARFHTRIGLHLGEIVLGDLRAGQRFEYAGMGDALNTAARIEALNKPLGTYVLASEPILQALGGMVLSRRLGWHRLRGKEETLQLGEILALYEHSTAAQYALCSSFEIALQAFEKRQWIAAQASFRGLLMRFPDDGPGQFFHDRAQAYALEQDADRDAILSL